MSLAKVSGATMFSAVPMLSLRCSQYGTDYNITVLILYSISPKTSKYIAVACRMRTKMSAATCICVSVGKLANRVRQPETW